MGKRGKVLYLIIESRPLVRDLLHSEDLIQDKEKHPHARRQDEPPVSNVRGDRGAKQDDQSRRFKTERQSGVNMPDDISAGFQNNPVIVVVPNRPVKVVLLRCQSF